MLYHCMLYSCLIHHSILYHSIIHHSMLYHSVVDHSMLYHSVVYHSMLYHSLLQCYTNVCYTATLWRTPLCQLVSLYSVESIILDEEAQFIHEVGPSQLNHNLIDRDGPDIKLVADNRLFAFALTIYLISGRIPNIKRLMSTPSLLIRLREYFKQI